MNPYDKFDIAQAGAGRGEASVNPYDKFDAAKYPVPESGGVSGFAKNALGAVVEPVASMVSGAFAKPASEVGGLAALGAEMIHPTGGDPRAFQQQLQEKLTYQPQTAAGKAVTEYNPIALLGKALGYGAEKVGGAVRGNAGADTMRGMAANALQEGLQQAPGILGAKAGKTAEISLPPRQTALDAMKSQNAVADATRTAAQKGGYITPPEYGIKSAASGLAGKAKTEKIISAKNAENATEKLGAEVGAKPGEPLSVEVRENLKQKAYDAYNAMTKAAGPKLTPTTEFRGAFKSTLDQLNYDISINKEANKDLIPARNLLASFEKQKEFPTDNALRTIKRQRKLAKSDFNNGNYEMGTARLAVSEQLENLFQDNLEKSGKRDLVFEFKNGRVNLAKLYLLDRIVNDATGKVDLSKLAPLSETKAYKGVLTGAFKDAADFSKAYRKAAQRQTGEAAPRLTVFDGMFAGGTILAAMAGHPAALAVGAGELAGRIGVPALAERGFLQNKAPSYQVGAARRAAPYALPAAGAAISSQAGGVPQPPE